LTAPTKNIFNDLHEERVDAGIAIESDPERVPGGIVSERLTRAEMALIAHPTHRLARARKPIDIGSLVAEPIIMSELTVGYGQVVLSLFADLGIRPNILAVADNIETMKAIVQSGTGNRHRPARQRRHRAEAGRGQAAADRPGPGGDPEPVPPPSAPVAPQGG